MTQHLCHNYCYGDMFLYSPVIQKMAFDFGKAGGKAGGCIPHAIQFLTHNC